MRCINSIQLFLFKGLTILLFFLTLTACDTHTTYRSSVPSCRVNIRISLYQYVDFVPGNSCAYMIVDEKGYHYNGQTMPRTETDRFGYAGVVVYIDGFGNYGAYDMACPNCVRQDKPVEINGMYAVCPLCGEEYNLYIGYATPQKGISNEALRRYNLKVPNGVITISN